MRVVLSGGGRAQVTGLVICGSLVWCRGCTVEAPPSSVMVARSLVAEVAMVLSLVAEEGVRDDDEDEGVRNVDAGESLFSEGGLGSRRRSQPCLSAWLGVIRVAGSQSRHRWMKSRNSGSLQPLSAVCSDFEPGGPRGFPLRDCPP